MFDYYRDCGVFLLAIAAAALPRFGRHTLCGVTIARVEQEF